MLDPMGNFWTMANPVRADGSPKVAEQHSLLRAWGIDPLRVNVTVWLPRGLPDRKRPNLCTRLQHQILRP